MFREREAIYVVHGAAVWGILTIATFPLIVTHPADCLRHPTKALYVYALMALAVGQFLGSALAQATRLAGHFPAAKALQFLLPFAAAALVGALHAAFAAAPMLVPDGTTLPLRGMPLRMGITVAAALAATPIIIIRSARMGARFGLRPPARSAPDPRWRA